MPIASPAGKGSRCSAKPGVDCKVHQCTVEVEASQDLRFVPLPNTACIDSQDVPSSGSTQIMLSTLLLSAVRCVVLRPSV